MSITDELRGFANSGMSAMECSAYSDKLIDIADRIDKTHEEELTKLKAENAKLREEFNKMDVWHSKELTAAMDENAKLRELARGLHMAYVETLNECESLNEGLIWECSGSIDDDIAKSKARFEVLRHRFDDALRELGAGVDE